MNTNLLENYKTAHLPLAAYLSVNGCQVLKIEAQGGRGVFTFAFVNRELINKFNTGQAVIEPGDFAIKMSQLTQTARRAINESNL